jgi:hypothetical protein
VLVITSETQQWPALTFSTTQAAAVAGVTALLKLTLTVLCVASQ